MRHTVELDKQEFNEIKNEIEHSSMNLHTQAVLLELLRGVPVAEDKKKYKVNINCDGVWYPYATYEDRDKANDVASQVRADRHVDVIVEEV